MSKDSKEDEDKPIDQESTESRESAKIRRHFGTLLDLFWTKNELPKMKQSPVEFLYFPESFKMFS